ncbi:MAG: phosphoribosylglycinamide formyltransferase [Rhodospirillales bacterium]
MVKLKLAVMISGRGSNLQALIDACADPAFPAEIILVLSNRPGAKGLDRADKAGIPTRVIDHKNYTDRAVFDREMTAAMEAAGTELVCLAGFMRLLSDEFVDHWRDRMINIHPSLLPAFKGLDVPERVLARGARFAGCTVHYVRKEMDTGPIIVQAVVPVFGDDTPDVLAARVLEREHDIYPLAVRLIAEGRVTIDENDRAVIDSAVAIETSLINPPGAAD